MDENRVIQRLHKLETTVRALNNRLGIVERSPEAFDRAGGLVACGTCKLIFHDHPKHPSANWLTILCDGSVVKL